MLLLTAALLLAMQTTDGAPPRVVLMVSNRCTVRADGARIAAGALKARAEQWTKAHREVDLRQGSHVSPNCLSEVLATLTHANTGIFIRNAKRRSDAQ